MSKASGLRFRPANGRARKHFVVSLPSEVSKDHVSFCGYKQFLVHEMRAFGPKRKRVKCAHIAALNIVESPTHYHRGTTETYQILRGSGKMVLNGRTKQIRPGDIIVIQPGTRHKLVADDTVRGVNALLTFNPSLAPRGSKYRDEIEVQSENKRKLSGK